MAHWDKKEHRMKKVFGFVFLAVAGALLIGAGFVTLFYAFVLGLHDGRVSFFLIVPGFGIVGYALDKVQELLLSLR